MTPASKLPAAGVSSPRAHGRDAHVPHPAQIIALLALYPNLSKVTSC